MVEITAEQKLAVALSTGLTDPLGIEQVALLLNPTTDRQGMIAAVAHPETGAAVPWHEAKERIAAGEFGTGLKAVLGTVKTAPEPAKTISIADLGKLDSAGLRAVQRGEIQVIR
jgi:hypothetical protein